MKGLLQQSAPEGHTKPILSGLMLFKTECKSNLVFYHQMSLQILVITIPGFVMNYTLILWYLQSVNKLDLKTIPWLLFSAVLISSDPMLTSASIRDLGRYPFLYFFLSYTEGIFCGLLVFVLRFFVRDEFSPCVVVRDCRTWRTGKYSAGIA